MHQCDSETLMQGNRYNMNRQPRVVGYLLCVIIVLEAATIVQTSGAGPLGVEDRGLIRQRVRRHGFSVTHDLLTLTKMLNDETRRRRMHSAEAFFNSLHKRRHSPTAETIAICRAITQQLVGQDEYT